MHFTVVCNNAVKVALDYVVSYELDVDVVEDACLFKTVEFVGEKSSSRFSHVQSGEIFSSTTPILDALHLIQFSQRSRENNTLFPRREEVWVKFKVLRVSVGFQAD